jgi:hypothetical protein
MQENIAFVKSGGFVLKTNGNGFVKPFDGFAGLAAKGCGKKVLSRKIIGNGRGIWKYVNNSTTTCYGNMKS